MPAQYKTHISKKRLTFESLPVGCLAATLVERDGDAILLGSKKEGAKRQKASLKAFYATEGVKPNSCPGCWMSTHPHPHALCDVVDDPKGEHKTATSAAHQVPAGWRKKHLKLLLTMALATPAEGAVKIALDARPRASASDFTAAGNSTAATPLADCGLLGIAAAGSVSAGTNTPLIDLSGDVTSGLIFAPFALGQGGAPMIGLPRASLVG